MRSSMRCLLPTARSSSVGIGRQASSYATRTSKRLYTQHRPVRPSPRQNAFQELPGSSVRAFSSSTSVASESKPKNVGNIWIPKAGTEDEYWREYETTRPSYSASGFMDVIYDYHGAKPDARFDVVHDVAAGAGHGAADLAKRFGHVVLSDDSGGSLDAARRRMAAEGFTDGERVSFVHVSGERLAERVPAGSADLVTVAESVTMMDEEAMLASFARVLRPGGTAAIWFYGRPRFTEPDRAPACQPLYDRIMDAIFARGMALGGPRMRPVWRTVATGIASWLDNVDMSASGHWADVRRIRWNDRIAADPGFWTQAACDFPITAASAVDEENETRVSRQDATFWAKSWDIADVRKYADYTFPNIDTWVGGDARMQELFRELEEAMGGPDAKREYTIACALILATRK